MLKSGKQPNNKTKPETKGFIIGLNFLRSNSNIFEEKVSKKLDCWMDQERLNKRAFDWVRP